MRRGGTFFFMNCGMALLQKQANILLRYNRCKSGIWKCFTTGRRDISISEERTQGAKTIPLVNEQCLKTVLEPREIFQPYEICWNRSKMKTKAKMEQRERKNSPH